MANQSFDVSLGREVEFYSRVDSNDPTNSAFILMVLTSDGLEADSLLRTYTTFSAILASTNDEVTNTGYSRITLTDAGLAAYTVDTANHTITLPLANQTFTTILAGDDWRKLIVGYDSGTTTGTDANMVPICHLDLLIDGVAVIPNGNNIILSFPNGLLIAR